MIILTQSDFSPLPHAPWLLNAVVDVKPHFNLSVTYNGGDSGLWHAGEWDNFEVAIQVYGDSTKYRSLVELPDNPNTNIYPNMRMADLTRLADKAMTLEYHGEIQVFVEPENNPAAKEKDFVWRHRFYTAKGHDHEAKWNYVKNTFGEKNCRFIQ